MINLFDHLQFSITGT